MKRLLLISSSRVHGTGFLEHCLDAIAEHLKSVDRLLFIPYALADHDHYEALVTEALKPIGINIDSIHRFNDPAQAAGRADAIFIGGGNSFRLLKTLHDLKLIDPIRQTIHSGAPYIGSSAGTNMACPTIRTSNDMPIVEPASFETLAFVPFQINPHFISADPNSTHQGETREQRIAEFHEENDTPVIGLREGSWIDVQGDDHCVLCGSKGAMLFQKDEPGMEIESGTNLSDL